MIFVTVGMHYQGFERLIRKMDEIAGKIDEEVVMQIGSTQYTPKFARYFDFVDSDSTIMDYFRNARVIVSHAGAGTLLNTLILGKPIIVVPRLKEFGEHIDDQQLELAKHLSDQGKVFALLDTDDLLGILTHTKIISQKVVKNNNHLVHFLKFKLEEA